MNWKYYNPKFEYEKILQDTSFPWAGHKYFAYDLVANIKPKIIVELGTEYGTSFWSFSQAVKDQQIFAELDAIDTWTGDVHIGHYGEEVFKKVKEIKNKFYPELKINLIRGTFDEALKSFSDNSIDVLHIDGTHTYEAVKHDFENWFPKVKDSGIILFHDIVVTRDDFGVYKFWKELKNKYQTIEFRYSYGLGVLFKGDNELYTLKDELELHYSYLLEDIENKKFTEILKSPSEKDELIQLKNQNIELKNEEIQSKNREIENQSVEIQSKNQEIQQKEQEIQQKEQEIQQKEQEILFIKSSKFWKLRELNFKIKFAASHPLKFIKKYSKKLSSLYGEAVNSLQQEGFRRMFSRVVNYVFYGKGVLHKKEILNRQRCAAIADRQNPIEKKLPVYFPFKTVFYVSNIPGGGAKKYIDDLIDNFETSRLRFVQINNREDLDLYKNSFKKDDILLFQYIFFSDLTFEDIINAKKKYGIRLVIPVHDFYFLQKKKKDFYQCHDGVYSSHGNKSSINPSVFNLLKTADLIIYPSNFVKNIFDSVFVFENAKLSRHIDYRECDFLGIPKVKKTINVGIINNVTACKGADYYPKLFSIKKYRGYDIQYHVFGMNKVEAPNVVFHGPYVEDEIFSLLKKNSIHGLVFLNKWGESYSYSLTKGINSGLPIFYSDIGAYTERLQNNSKFFPVNNIENIELDMQKMLAMILNNHNSSSHNKIIPTTKDIPDLYKNLFSIDYNTILNDQFYKNKKQYEQLFNTVEPYAIYFPQFHALKENGKTFYEGYHDMINLEQAKKTDQSIETPIKNYLGYYNLKEDSGIIEKQILLAKANGLKGFGIYYYWFSRNSVTGNNMLMKEVIDKFFQKDLDNFDVFFIYANESWSNNPAFNQHTNEYIIKNEYSTKEITKNFENLLPYFKHANYKKIDNKPVFFIHHPWEMTPDEFKLFYSIGDEIMKNNGFAGIELVANGMHGNYEGYKNYSHHPNYKSTETFTSIEDGMRYIDYKKYIDDFLPNTDYQSNNIQTVFYNFNNAVRYFNHKNKAILVTKTINNSPEYFRKFLISQIHTYNSPDKVGKILLINSWNEWGEQMAIEPSSESGFKLLDTFNEVILEFVKKNNIKEINTKPFVSISAEKSPFMFEHELGEKEISVILHLYYTDMWDEIKKSLNNIPYPYTLIISLTKGNYSDNDIERIKQFNPKTHIHIFENRGMDILPFLKCLKFVPKTTKYILKIHTKKSLYAPEIGSEWFTELINHSLPDKKTVDMILHNLEYTDIGMIGGGVVPGFEYSGIFKSTDLYEPKIELIHKYYNSDHTAYKWIAGSIFWVRFDIINKFDDEFIDFIEKHQPLGYFKNGTIIHGLERYFSKLVYDVDKIISLNPIQRYSKNYITSIPEKNITSAQKDIYLFFHICCIGNYNEIVHELVNSLIESGLYEKSIKVFYTTLGCPSIVFVKWLESFSKFECIHRSTDIEEVEYPTLFYLQDFCKKNDAYIMYFHSKGVSNSYGEYKTIWRKRLMQKTILEYKNCISFLNLGCDIAGCGWKEHPYHNSVITDYTTWTHSHFSGNFWWAQSTYIKLLPDIRSVESNYKKIGTPIDYKPSNFELYRIFCEMWIGMKKNIKIGVNGDLNKEYGREDKNYITSIPEKNITSAQKDIYLFLNISCTDNYVDEVRELVYSLMESGLYEESKKVFYTILGNKNKNFLKWNDYILKWLSSFSKFECIYMGFDTEEIEYHTLFCMQDFCKENNAYVMYLNIKSVYNSSNEDKIIWQKNNIQKTIYEYKRCVSFLNKGCDISGYEWKEYPDSRSVIIGFDILTRAHFLGNFWWAQSTYIKSLPNIRLVESNYKKIKTLIDATQSDFERYSTVAETWIGMKNNILIGINDDLNK